MNVLLARRLRRSLTTLSAWAYTPVAPAPPDLFVAPGTLAGTSANLLPTWTSKRRTSKVSSDVAKKLRIDLVVHRPRRPSLAKGLADRLAVEGIAAFGPAQAAIRASANSQGVLQRPHAPTAESPQRIVVASTTSATKPANYAETSRGRCPVVHKAGRRGSAGEASSSTTRREEAGSTAIDRLMGDEAILAAASGSTVSSKSA